MQLSGDFMKNSILLWAAILSLTLGLSACKNDDDDGDGGGGGSSAVRTIRVTRVGTIADGATDALGAISTLSAAPQLTYTIHNDGSQDLTLSGGPGFVAASAITNVTGSAVTIGQPAAAVIVAGGSQTFTVDYQVAAAGAFGFTLSFASDADAGQSGATFEIVVSGTGDNSTRVLVVTRSGTITDGGSDGVGSIDASTASPALTYTLTNNGTGAMSFTGSAPFVTVAASPAPVNITGTPAITQPTSGTIASGGGTQTFTVNYQIAGAGAFSFTVQFGTDATTGQTGPTFEIMISGTGTVPSRNVTVSRAFTPISDGGTLDLGNRGWTVVSQSVRIEIANNGTDPLTLTGSSPWVAVSGTPVNLTGSPTITQPASGTVAAGSSVFFSFTFTVTALGNFSFTLQFGSNATTGQTGATFEINVTGKGHPSLSFEKRFPTSSTEPYAVGVDQGSPEIRTVTGGFAAGATNFPGPIPSPNGRYLLFTHQATSPGDRHVFVVSMTGGTPVQITPNTVGLPAGEYRANIHYEWGSNSAGDQLLAVMADHQSAENCKKLYTCVISGTTPTVNNWTEVTGYGTIDVNRRGFNTKWSADGTRLAFQLYVFTAGVAQRELWACAFSAGVPSAATDMKGTGAFTNAQVHWGGSSSDYGWAGNSTLIFAADADTANAFRMYAVAVGVSGGGTLTAGARINQTSNLSGTDSIQSYGPSSTGWSISPNATRLAFVRTGTGVGHVFVTELNTSAPPTPVQMLTGITAQANGGGQYVAWSPNGLTLAFTGDFNTDNANDLYLQLLTSATGAVAVSGNTQKLTSLAALEYIRDVAFSPDGQRLLFQVLNSNTGINRVDLARLGASPTIVTIASGFTVTTAFINRPRFKPGTADYVAFMGDTETAGEYEASVIPLGGPELMTPGTRFIVSGTYTAFGISNLEWVP